MVRFEDYCDRRSTLAAELLDEQAPASETPSATNTEPLQRLCSRCQSTMTLSRIFAVPVGHKSSSDTFTPRTFTDEFVAAGFGLVRNNDQIVDQIANAKNDA
ncbi:MAG: hypothetical protein R3C53_16230 [Pirellulaceae bacterium]